MNQAGERLAPKGSYRSRVVYAGGPAAESGCIRNTIRVLQRGRGVFPRTVFCKAPPERLSASQQAVMGIRERERREEGECPSTKRAKPTSDFNPVVVLIVRLLATAPVADNRIAFTQRTSAQQHVAVVLPVGFGLVRRGRKWDKNNR
jgi:hypothetical protein